MLATRPWKPDAVIRLLLSVFLCIYGGSLVLGLVHFIHTHGKAGAKFYPAFAVALLSLVAALVLIRKPWSLDNFMKRAVALLVCIYLALFLGMWAQQLAWPIRPDVPTSGQMLLTVLSFQGTALVWVALFLREHRMSWSEGFGFRHERVRAVLIGLLTACLFLPVGWRLQTVSADWLEWATKQVNTYLPHFHYAPETQTPVQTLRNAVSWPDRFALGVLTILVVPVAEELLFRGILYAWLKQAGFPRLALFGSSLLFAAMHLNLMTFLPLFLLALLLVGLYEWTNNLLAPITAHALFNALNFVVLYLFDTPAFTK